MKKKNLKFQKYKNNKENSQSAEKCQIEKNDESLPDICVYVCT